MSKTTYLRSELGILPQLLVYVLHLFCTFVNNNYVTNITYLLIFRQTTYHNNTCGNDRFFKYS